jgi:hypothetical protein
MINVAALTGAGAPGSSRLRSSPGIERRTASGDHPNRSQRHTNECGPRRSSERNHTTVSHVRPRGAASRGAGAGSGMSLRRV